jgi:DNA processing protein
MEQLITRTGLTTAELGSILLVMELEGRVVARHGRYSRLRAVVAGQGARKAS